MPADSQAAESPPADSLYGTRIVIVRHGESAGNAFRIVAGHAGCTGLTELGRRQVAALGDRLRRTGEVS
ncbi:MAG TPA: phosphoglycerate mutase family protein, partial [Acidimicrobiales bacterium]|nr:phosphoglycerate mutase family protein [Acidimicrobiales bacterium]